MCIKRKSKYRFKYTLIEQLNTFYSQYTNIPFLYLTEHWPEADTPLVKQLASVGTFANGFCNENCNALGPFQTSNLSA